MNTRWIFIAAGAGLVAAVALAIYNSGQKRAEAPVFNPAANPYQNGVYATGIIQSNPESGKDTSIYPEVGGTVVAIPVTEGQTVRRGEVLVVLDDSIPQGTVGQLRAQVEAARAMLAELQAQPRPETLAVAVAQVDVATANLKLSTDELDKLEGIYAKDPRLISKDQLDTQRNTVQVNRANLDVARRQLELTRAGAWRYDIENQRKQVEALEKAYESAQATLAKYTIRAPADGQVLTIQTMVGSYVSAQGTYDELTGGNLPVVALGAGNATELSVRCFIDEILIQRAPLSASTPARLFVRGTDTSVPLRFVRVQPYVSPKIELTNARTERVDLRVLTVIFSFVRPPGIVLYPGQIVDVYIGGAGAVRPRVRHPPDRDDRGRGVARSGAG